MRPDPAGFTHTARAAGPPPGGEEEGARFGPPRAPRAGRHHEPQERPPPHPPRARTSFGARRSVHYGRAETAVWATWTTGTETPCTGRRTVRAVESRTSPAM